jgi:hypothetical protein
MLLDTGRQSLGPPENFKEKKPPPIHRTPPLPLGIIDRITHFNQGRQLTPGKEMAKPPLFAWTLRKKEEFFHPDCSGIE